MYRKSALTTMLIGLQCGLQCKQGSSAGATQGLQNKDRRSPMPSAGLPNVPVVIVGAIVIVDSKLKSQLDVGKWTAGDGCRDQCQDDATGMV